MRIGYRNKRAGRVKTVAGKDYTFEKISPNNPASDCFCDVKDEAAIGIFLAPKNANLFYDLDAKPTALTRSAPTPVIEPEPEGDAANAAAKALVDGTAADLIEAIEASTDRTFLVAVQGFEDARDGGARKGVTKALEKRLETVK